MAFQLDHSRARVRPSMNVTPLVDVVLVLLIIFMVITPMLVKQLWMHVPQKQVSASDADKTEPEPSQSLVLSLRRDGTIRVNKEKVTAAELPERLSRFFAARREHVLFFDADDDLPYGRAMEVLDLARGGGAAHIAILTEPLQE